MIAVGRYHKIPGDQCNGGFTPAGSKRVDLDETCKEGDKAILMGQTITTPAAITSKVRLMGQTITTPAAITSKVRLMVFN